MRKISIKPNQNTDRVNLDINLRLVDFLNDKNMLSYQTLNNYNQPRSYQQFSNKNDISNDPLERHIKKFEQSARSFPVPIANTQRKQPQQLVSAPNRDSYTNNRQLQAQNYQIRKPFGSDSELQSNNRQIVKDGYAAQLMKSQTKPSVKPHTLKDFRQYKRDNRLTHGTTGKLGFDFDNEFYKEKLKQTEKKQDYAMRVKARNSRILNEFPKKPVEQIQPQQKRNNTLPRISNSNKDRVPFRTENNSTNISSFSSSDKTGFYKIRNDELYSSTKQSKRPVQLNNDYSAYDDASPRRIPNNNSQMTVRGRESRRKNPEKGFYRIRDPITQKVQTVYKSYQPEEDYEDEQYQPQQNEYYQREDLEEIPQMDQQYNYDQNEQYISQSQQQQQQPQIVYVVQDNQSQQVEDEEQQYNNKEFYDEPQDVKVVKANGVPLSFPPKRWNN